MGAFRPDAFFRGAALRQRAVRDAGVGESLPLRTVMQKPVRAEVMARFGMWRRHRERKCLSSAFRAETLAEVHFCLLMHVVLNRAVEPGIAAYCARAASGHAAAPPTNAIKSRRVEELRRAAQ